MKKIITASTIALSLTLGATGYAAGDHHEKMKHMSSEAVPAGMALKHEMRLLSTAYKNLISSILLDTPEEIEAPFHEVHKAKLITEKALHEGKVKLPQNGDKLEEFVKMDEAFHGKLKKLLGAARKKDRKAIQESAHEILDSCVQCHSMFRN